MAVLRYAEVRFKDRPAGVLRETAAGGSVFEYRDGFGEDLGCALPRDVPRHEWSVGLHPFFQHLAPEGWLRARQVRTGEIEAQDDLGLLLRYGADCIGAVSVHDRTPADLPPEGDLDALTRAAVTGKRTISGVQPKLLVRREGDRFVPAGASGPAPYIAKFATAEIPELVPNERLSLELTRELLGKAQVVESHFGGVEGIRLGALLVKRFDRTETGEKRRLEDLAQILVVPRGLDYSGKYDASFEQVAGAIERYSALPRVDLLRFFERLVVFFLLGNCDAHLKNFSLLEVDGGLRLSPVYDVVNTYVFARRGFSTRFGLRFGDAPVLWDQIDRDRLGAFGRDIGLRGPAVEKVLRDLGRKRERVCDRLRGLAERSDWLYQYWASAMEAFDRRDGGGG